MTALVSRQFVEISRARIESLLTAFPKLVANSSKQYTFVDGPGVRFVYQPMDDLYAVIITNKASNIVEDLETLQLITNIVRSEAEIRQATLLVCSHRENAERELVDAPGALQSPFLTLLLLDFIFSCYIGVRNLHLCERTGCYKQRIRVSFCFR